MTASATLAAPATKPLSKRERHAAHAWKRIQKIRDQASAKYALADRMTFALAKLLGGHGKIIRITPEGRGLRVVDPLRAATESPKYLDGEMPKAWAHAAVRQFGLEELKQIPSAS